MGELTERSIVREPAGAAVEIWAPGVFEVEASSGGSRTCALTSLKAERLVRLNYDPLRPAA